MDILEIPAPPARRGIAMQRILVPIDFSGGAVAALEYAAQLSRAMGSEVCLLHVVRPGPAARLDKTCAAMRAQLLVLADLIWGGRSPVEVAVAVGVPWLEIVRAARFRQADLIVLSTEGCRGLLRLLRRNTAARVIREAARPVLVAPAPVSGVPHMAMDLGIG